MDLPIMALFLTNEEAKYNINEYGVVLDPLIVFSYRLDNKSVFDSMRICIAKLSQGYASSSSANTKSGGYSGPVSANFRTFPTLIEALKYEVGRIKKFYEDETLPKATKAISEYEQSTMEDESYLASIESRLLFRSKSPEGQASRSIYL